MHSRSRHTSALYNASLCSTGYGTYAAHHLSAAVQRFHSLVLSLRAVSVASLLSLFFFPEQLSSKVETVCLFFLLGLSSPARLLSAAASWCLVCPSCIPWLPLEPLIQWWAWPVYLWCLGSALDSLSLTCMHGEDLVATFFRYSYVYICTRTDILRIHTLDTHHERFSQKYSSKVACGFGLEVALNKTGKSLQAECKLTPTSSYLCNLLVKYSSKCGCLVFQFDMWF